MRDSLARGQAQRADKLLAELNALLAFRPEPLPPRGPIVFCVVVEVEHNSTGRTFFLAPAVQGEPREQTISFAA